MKLPKKKTKTKDEKQTTKVAEEKSTKGAKAKKNQGLSSDLWIYALGSIVVSTFGIGFTLLLIWWQVINAGNLAQQKAQNVQIADQYTAFFNSRAVTLKNQIDQIANSPSVINALNSFEPQLHRAEADRIRTQFKYADRVDLIKRGEAQVDLNAATPITFGALDVIKRAESQPYAGPEAFKLGQKIVIYVARPITSDGKISGVLFMALSMNYFLGPVQMFDPSSGSLILQQRFESAPDVDILQYGAEADSTEDPIYRQLESINWRLSFRAAKTGGSGLLSWNMLILPFTAALAVILGTAFLGFGRLFRALDQDGVRFMDETGRLLRGRAPGIDAYKLNLFQALAENTRKIARARSPQGTVTKRDKPKFKFDTPAVTADAAQEPEQKTTSAADNDDSEEFLEVRRITKDEENFGIEVTEDTSPRGMGLNLEAEIFRAYDIRGVVTSSLTGEVVYWIGRAFAAEARDAGQKKVAVGRDGRLSSPELSTSLIKGLNEGGVDVVDVGMVPTPLLYYATHSLNTGTGIMITGSHNPPDYNGLKMMLAGVTLAEDRIQTLRERIENDDLPKGEGACENVEIIDSYIDRVAGDVVLGQAPKVVIDCGNGVAGAVAPQLLRELGCEVVELYCEVDGNFPNHHPDPAEMENLADLITVVEAENADLGLAFDGDGDRLGVVTNRGSVVWPDKLLMLFSRDIVGRNPGSDIIYDVKCSRHLNTLISEYGGRPIMCKTGHSHIKAKIIETGALLGGEFSGHICFAERWYGFDDALYSAARLLEITSGETKSVEELFDEFPVTFMTPELKIQTTESRKTEVMEQLSSLGDFGDGTLTTIDGIRVDYSDGWGLIRQSNTSPVLTLRFEADGQAPLDRIQDIFQAELHKLDPELSFKTHGSPG